MSPSAPIEEAPPHGLQIVQGVVPLVERDLQMSLESEIGCSVLGKDGGQVIVRATWPPKIQQDLWIWPRWEEAATIVLVVERLQDSDFFDHLTEPWPRCRVHPGSGHSMTVRSFRDGAWWICPETGKRTAPVGRLMDPPEGLAE